MEKKNRNINFTIMTTFFLEYNVKIIRWRFESPSINKI